MAAVEIRGWCDHQPTAKPGGKDVGKPTVSRSHGAILVAGRHPRTEPIRMRNECRWPDPRRRVPARSPRRRGAEYRRRASRRSPAETLHAVKADPSRPSPASESASALNPGAQSQQTTVLLKQPGSLVEAEDAVEVLHRDSACPANQVILGREYQHFSANYLDADIQEVCASRVLRCRRICSNAHKRCGGIIVPVELRQCGLRDGPCGRRIDRAENTAIHWHQVRRENDRYRRTRHIRKCLFNLRRMPVGTYSIRRNAFIAFWEMEVQFWRASTAGNTALAVDHDTGQFNQLVCHQRRKPQNRGLRVATRVCDEPRTRQLIAIHFRQSIDRLIQILRVVVCFLVPLLVNLHVA